MYIISRIGARFQSTTSCSRHNATSTRRRGVMPRCRRDLHEKKNKMMLNLAHHNSSISSLSSPMSRINSSNFFFLPSAASSFFMKKHIKIKFHGEHFNLKCNLSLTSSVVAKPVERCLIAFSAPRFFYVCCYQKFNVKFSISFSFYGLMDEWEMIFRFLLCASHSRALRALRLAVETHTSDGRGGDEVM